MRDIQIKTTTSENHKRKNLLIVEMIDQDGFVARAEKKYSYYVSEQKPDLQKPEELKQWMDSQAHSFQKKDRHVSITKTLNPSTGIGQMIYRVIGSFYVVQNLHVFAVVFMHSIKFDMISGSIPGIDQLPA